MLKNVVSCGCESCFCLGVYSTAIYVNCIKLYQHGCVASSYCTTWCAQTSSIDVILKTCCGTWFSHTQWKYLALFLRWHSDIYWHPISRPISLYPAMPICIPGTNTSIYFKHATKQQWKRERERAQKLWPSVAYKTVGVPLILLALQRQASRSSRVTTESAQRSISWR